MSVNATVLLATAATATAKKSPQEVPNMMLDIVIPCTIIAVLFIANAFIFNFIMRQRKQIVYEEYDEVLPVPSISQTTAAQALAAAQQPPLAQEEVIELEEL